VLTSPPPIPADPSELTIGWLTQVLRRPGVIEVGGAAKVSRRTGRPGPGQTLTLTRSWPGRRPRVQTGSIGVNGYTLDPGSPFGGVKASGIGREPGSAGLATFQQLKSIFLPLFG
jgi:Aldehyde dehydrogenase family